MAIAQYFAQMVNLVKTGYRSNAFAPYVWFTSIVSVIEIITMIIITDTFVRYVITVTLAITIMFGMFMYYKLFNKDPKLLQSERYRLEDKKLDLISQKGSNIVITPVNLSTPNIDAIDEGGNDA